MQEQEEKEERKKNGEERDNAGKQALLSILLRHYKLAGIALSGSTNDTHVLLQLQVVVAL